MTKKYADGYDEQAAIAAGNFWVDMFGTKHGTRPTSPDEAVAKFPVTAEMKAAELAVNEASARRQVAADALIKAMQPAQRQTIYDYKTNTWSTGAPDASEVTIKRLKEALKDAEEVERKALLVSSRLDAARAQQIRNWNAAQVVETPLQKAIAEAQRNRSELTEAEVARLRAIS